MSSCGLFARPKPSSRKTGPAGPDFSLQETELLKFLLLNIKIISRSGGLGFSGRFELSQRLAQGLVFEPLV